jgi:hypothetical protein
LRAAITVFSAKQAVKASMALEFQAMRRGLILLIAAAVLISALAVCSSVRAAATRKRETGYSLALKAYSEALHAGMTRKDIEDYLRSRKTQFRSELGPIGGRPESQYADLVKIGEEAAFFCSKAYVYVAFEFSPAYDFRLHTDADVLQRIEIIRPGCGSL